MHDTTLVVVAFHPLRWAIFRTLTMAMRWWNGLWQGCGLVGLQLVPAFCDVLPLPSAEETTSRSAFLLKVIYSCCWLCIVALLSFPSVAYAVVSAIPFNNTLKLSAWWLKFFHYQAALVMVLVDMFITPKLVAFFSDATGLRRSMLLMAARLGTMWLAAVLSTLYLTTHCMNGWTHFWKVARLCAPSPTCLV